MVVAIRMVCLGLLVGQTYVTPRYSSCSIKPKISFGRRPLQNVVQRGWNVIKYFEIFIKNKAVLGVKIWENNKIINIL